MNEDPLLTVEEAAGWLNVSDSKIRRMCEMGELEGAFKVGAVWRVPSSAVAAYISRRQAEARRD